jgi:hypothetical protein
MLLLGLLWLTKKGSIFHRRLGRIFLLALLPQIIGGMILTYYLVARNIGHVNKMGSHGSLAMVGYSACILSSIVNLYFYARSPMSIASSIIAFFFWTFSSIDIILALLLENLSEVARENNLELFISLGLNGLNELINILSYLIFSGIISPQNYLYP